MRSEFVSLVALAISALATGIAASGGEAQLPATDVESELARGATLLNCGAQGDSTERVLESAKRHGGLLVLPARCKIDRRRVLESLPPDAVILDLSMVNDFASEGETTKTIGILSRDSARNDAQWQIASGHHAVLNLSNFGSADSASAGARRASILWSAGDFEAAPSKNGFRGAAILQFGEETEREEWSFSVRSLAPWRAVKGDFERWEPNENIAGAGVYRATGDAHLVSVGPGTTGQKEPVGNPGSIVADGSVRWRTIDSSDRSVMRINENGKVLFGLGDFSANFRHKVSPFHPGPNISEWSASGLSKDVFVYYYPTDSQGNETAVPALRATAGQGLVVLDTEGGPTAIFHPHGGVRLSSLSTATTQMEPNGGALDVANRSFILVNGDGTSTLRHLRGGLEGQVVSLQFLEDGLVLQNGQSPNGMHLERGSNATMSAGTVINLRKMPERRGGYWVEISRSAK